MNLLWVLLIVVLLEGPSCSVLSSPGAPAVDAGAISVLRHEMQLAIDPSSHRMRGMDRVTIQAGRGRSVSSGSRSTRPS